jgi:hypothetical protein
VQRYYEHYYRDTKEQKTHTITLLFHQWPKMLMALRQRLESERGAPEARFL